MEGNIMAEFTTDCKECGRPFPAKRSTAMYCSAKCRQRASRKHPAKVNVSYEALNASDSLQRILSLNDEQLNNEIHKLESLWRDVKEIRQRTGMSLTLD